MIFYFCPSNENTFKENAVGNYVRTLVFDRTKNAVVLTFARKVSKKWEQSVKNNIETDHRIKSLSGDSLEIYSWVTATKSGLALPHFVGK